MDNSTDFFSNDFDCYVNPVNCVGVMGAGLAKEFKARFPHNYRVYRDFCKSGYLAPGKILFVPEKGKFIANFPTKVDWRDPSKLEYIQLGLAELINVLENTTVKTIAMPALGCGLGGLQRNDVFPLILDTFKNTHYSLQLF